MSARGEGTINADGREVLVLFTNRALAEAEHHMGKSAMGVANSFSSGDASLTDLAYLLRAGMEAARRDARLGGKPVSMEMAYKVLDEAGFVAVATVVMTAVADVLSYSGAGANSDDDDAEKN